MTNSLGFLSGGGAAERIIRSRDWSAHAMGPPEDWPDAFKIALSLVLNSPESMILCWGSELHFFFNEAYFPLLGPRLSWAMGERFEMVWADGWDQAKSIIAAAMAGHGERFTDLPWKLNTDRGARDTWWTFSYSRVLDAHGQVAGLFIFTNETTDRVLSEAALRASETIARTNVQRVQLALAAGAIIGTWLWDIEQDKFTVDEAFCRAFGLDPALGYEGLSLAQLLEPVHPDDRPGLVQAINEAVSRGGAYARQYRTRRADGHYYWLEANGRVELGADNTAISFPGVLIDVEDRRALIEERDRAAAALRSLNETLEQRVADRTHELMRAEEQLRQAQKMEAVGQLTGGLAHDFNNLLAGISGSLELIDKRIQQGRFKDIEKYLAAAQGASKRAAALTHRLLAFSRRQTLAPKATDISPLVIGMLEIIRRTTGPSVDVEYVDVKELWTVLVDPSQLENALLNLCINARDAMPNGGRIVIQTAHCELNLKEANVLDMNEGQFVVLSVSDNGTGMSPDVIERAFDPFFTTKPIGEGTGLGLSMIYGFAKQSGGQVRIHSQMGIGTSVSVYLPRHAGKLEMDRVSARAASSPVAKVGETVLVVDDEPTVRMLAIDVLTELGYTPLEAADGAAGLKVLRSDARIDLLVTDVGLPGGMNGRQMADAARVRRPDLKVLFITGFAENVLLTDGQLEPGMAVLTKPFSIDVLGARIREMING